MKFVLGSTTLKFIDYILIETCFFKHTIMDAPSYMSKKAHFQQSAPMSTITWKMHLLLLTISFGSKKA